MATTTNYGWTTPDDTALVKDGAAAIRTLGSSVDTTTKNLNPETTLGDIAYRSSTANVKTRLGIGTTGQVLSVSGGVPAWTSPASAGLNFISRTSFTASSAVNVNNVFSTNYDSYRLIIRAANSTGSPCPMSVRFRVSGTDTSANYQYQEFYAIDTSTAARKNYMGTDEAKLGDNGSSSNIGNMIVVDITSPFAAVPTSYIASAMGRTPDVFMDLNSGVQTDDTSFTGFTLLTTETQTGIVDVYGYAKA